MYSTSIVLPSQDVILSIDIEHNSLHSGKSKFAVHNYCGRVKVEVPTRARSQGCQLAVEIANCPAAATSPWLWRPPSWRPSLPRPSCLCGLTTDGQTGRVSHRELVAARELRP
eukprot:scaffold666_cov332-Prasinococcus_capsulatus_cf.AAC.15